MMGRNFGVGALAIVGLFLVAGQVKSDNSWESMRNERLVSEDLNRFAFNLYATLLGGDHGIAENENAVMSTSAVAVLLTMAANGASGYTQREIEQAIFRKYTIEKKNGLASLLEKYENFKKWEVDMINTIFYNNTYNLKASFNDAVKKDYQSNLMSVDFSMSDETRDAVNNWADRESHSHIKNFMPKAKFNSSTSMLLVSGAHMRGIWAVPFHETSVKKPFYTRYGSTHEVTMLHASGLFSVGYLYPDYSAKIIKIHYEGEEISNYIVVPYGHSLDSFEKNLRSMHLNDFETHYYAKKMNLYVPKLRIESTFCLERSLRKLNMNKMWTREAEFTEINTEDRPMWANKVFHKASIVIDEYKNESANYQTTEANPDAENFYLDRPFFLLTVYKGVILFMTRVTDPTSFF